MVLDYKTKDDVKSDAVQDYLENLNKDDLPSLQEIATDLVFCINKALDEASIKYGEKYKRVERLDNADIVDVMLACKDIAMIRPQKADDTEGCLTIYCEDGEKAGLHVTDDKCFDKVILALNRQAKEADRKEIKARLRIEARTKYLCTDPDLVPVKNGIYSMKDKMLLPFSPDYVFFAKAQVNYNPFALNSKFAFTDKNGAVEVWDVEDWLLEIASGDIGVKNLLYEVISSVLRVNVKFNHFIILSGSQGNGGKGTFAELLRHLVGESSCSALSLKQLSDEPFALEDLVGKSLCISDENETKTVINNSTVVKAMVTGDTFSINPKFKKPFSYCFKGRLICCANDVVTFKDDSDSVWRRYLNIPFKQCYTGVEDKSIKDVKVVDNRVLEYILNKALQIDVDTYTVPEVCKRELEIAKESSSPVRQWFNEFRTQFTWDFLPQSFLREFFHKWFRETKPGKSIPTDVEFTRELINVVRTDPMWEYKEGRIRPGRMMENTEFIIAEYELTAWENPNYRGPDVEKRCMPALKAQYVCGLVRVKTCLGDDYKSDYEEV